MPVQSANHANLTSNAQLHSFAEKLLAVIEELRARSALRRLMGNISDRQLRDVGLIRNDLDAACDDSRLSYSAGLELQAAARDRTGNW